MYQKYLIYTGIILSLDIINTNCMCISICQGFPIFTQICSYLHVYILKLNIERNTLSLTARLNDLENHYVIMFW